MQTPTLAKVIQDAIEARLTGVHTMLPGRVVKIDIKKGKCDVQPLIKRIGADGQAVTLPVIPNCPIGFYRAGKAAIYLPVAVGHSVEIKFCERSLDIWLTKGGTIDPEDRRKHNLSDAVVYPGLYDFTDPPSEASASRVIIVNDAGRIEIDPSGKFLLKGPSDEVIDLLIQGLGKLSDTIQKLTQVQTPTMMGPQTFLPTDISDLSTLKTGVDEIKSKLTGLKG